MPGDVPTEKKNRSLPGIFDAIVIGSGISGGWAAKELCEAGLKTLVLERGRDVRHIKDYPTATRDPWEFPHRKQVIRQLKKDNPVVSKCYAFDETAQHFFVKDAEHPYIQEKPFDWIRGYQVGGKSLMWGRETQRWSRFDFEGPHRDNYAVDWPLRYEELAPWYSHVERFVGIAGNRDGIETMPDGEFLPPWEMNAVEKHLKKQISAHYPDRHLLTGRVAHLTRPNEIHRRQGRGKCQARDMCSRGCPYGGYFSSNSSTLPEAERTGNLTLRTNAVVHSVLYDDRKKRATGVRVIDRISKEVTDYHARIIFVNAACLNTNLLLLNSVSDRFPHGLGNDHGLLGKYLAFQNYRGFVFGKLNGFENSYYYGRRPAQSIMPSFRNIHRQETDFLRGYVVFAGASREGWERGNDRDGIGSDFKKELTEPGPWSVYLSMQGETIPKVSNQVRLSPTLKDEWGIPQLMISVAYDDNDEKQLRDFFAEGSAMLEKAGCHEIRTMDTGQAPGLDIHEMGGVRMGRDPKTSLLNGFNQMHNVKNVFVTDGSCMPSTGTQNPSLTFMALTARAAGFAIAELKTGNL